MWGEGEGEGEDVLYKLYKSPITASVYVCVCVCTLNSVYFTCPGEDKASKINLQRSEQSNAMFPSE